MGSTAAKELRVRHRNAVVGAIKNAFATVKLNDGLTLHQARALDDWEPEEAVLASRSKDSETHWSEVTEEELSFFNDVHIFLDRKGWAFYIPAYMLWVLSHLDDVTGDDVSLSCHTIYSITDRDSGSELLTSEQRGAVIAFLQHLARYCRTWEDDARYALKSIWRKVL